MLSKPIAVPKPVSSRGKRTRTHLKRMAEWRDQVWFLHGFGEGDDQYGFCTKCSKRVWRRRMPLAACDHILARSTAPELKYNPLNGQLLCAVGCHQQKHGLEMKL